MVFFKDNILSIVNYSESIADDFHQVPCVLTQVESLDWILAQVTGDFTIIDDRDVLLVFMPLDNSMREVKKQFQLVLVTSILIGAQRHHFEVVQL